MMDKMIPKAFFVTGGKALTKVSRLNTFDLALKDAGIAQCNLVEVSSVIPPNCRETKMKNIPAGSITYAVISKAEGKSGKISAGIVWGTEKNNGHGVVAEAYGTMDEKETRKKLAVKIREMAKIRGIELDVTKFRVESLEVPENSYGCVVAALIYIL